LGQHERKLLAGNLAYTGSTTQFGKEGMCFVAPQQLRYSDGVRRGIPLGEFKVSKGHPTGVQAGHLDAPPVRHKLDCVSEEALPNHEGYMITDCIVCFSLSSKPR